MDEGSLTFRIYTFGFHEQFETRASLPVVPDMHGMRATYVIQSFDNNTFDRKSKRFSSPKRGSRSHGKWVKVVQIFLRRD